MAGAGYKLFNTGDVLLASEVNTYLQQQVTMVFANAAARTSALSAVLAEGMMSYLQDTNTVEVYNGTSWVNVGNAGDITEVQAGTGISVASGTGPIPVVTNSMATEITAKGDLIVGTGSGTFDNLAVGTNGYTLVADSSETTGLKWQAASSGALTKISRTTFSNVASQSFDGVFTSTYTAYLVVVEVIYGSIDANLLLQYQTGTNTVKATNYYSGNFYINSSASQTLGGDHAATSITVMKGLYTSSDASAVSFWVTPAGNASDRTTVFGSGFSNNKTAMYSFGGFQANADTYTGMKFSASTGNITGTIAVYGLAE